MNASPTRSGAPPSSSNNKSSNAAVGPSTLLQVVAGLSASIKTAFEPARSGSNDSRDTTYDPTLLHSLAVPSTATKDLKLPLELLTSTLSAFENQVLNEQNTGTSTNNDKLRLLALSKEHSTLQLQDLQNKQGVSFAKRVLERRALYSTSFPFSLKESASIQDILEATAKECGLEIFPGAEEDGAGMDAMMMDEAASEALPTTTSTVTMAGKGIVLDIDVESKSKIRAVRFSYGLEGSTDGGIDKLLSKQARERDWEALRNSLMKLARIDRLVETVDGEPSTVDPFSAMKNITIKLEQLFKAELEIASSPSELLTRGHGLAITHFSEPYTLLLYYLPILHTYSDIWQEAVQSGLQAEAISKLLALDGAGSIRIEVAVGKLEKGTCHRLTPDTSLLGAVAGDLDEEIGEGVHYIARLNRPLLATQAAGRILESIVTGQNSTAPSHPPAGNPENAFLTRLLPSIQACVRYDIGQDKDMQIQATIARSGARAFQITSLPFSSVSQLWRIIEVIRQQTMLNELLTSLFENARVSEKIDEESVTLESLLSDTTEAVSLYVEADLDTFPASLHVSCLLPHLPGWLALSISLRITLSPQSPSGLAIEYDLHGGRPELVKQVFEVLNRDNGHAKLQAILGATRDLRPCIRWINQRLYKHRDEVVQGFDRPGDRA